MPTPRHTSHDTLEGQATRDLIEQKIYHIYWKEPTPHTHAITPCVYEGSFYQFQITV